MKHLLSTLPAILFFSVTVHGQQAAVISPEIKDDHSVTFRIRDPKAQSIQLRGQWDRKQVDMAKDEAGLWTITVPQVKPGVWEYSFVVDGLTMIDPLNPVLK